MRRRAPLRIVAYRHSQTAKFAIEGLRINGKRQRRFFKTKAEAAKELERLKGIQQREGERGLAVSDAVRLMAVDGAERLAPHGKTIADAVEFYLQHLGDAQRNVTVAELVQDYLIAQARARRSKVHRDDLRQRLGRFAEAFGTRSVRTITTKEVAVWLDGLGLAPQTTNNFHARLSGLFAHALQHELIDRNPLKAIRKVSGKDEDGAPEIFTPAELEALLNAAPPELVPLIAIGAFAGLRTAELMRMDWSEVTTDYVHVPAHKSKTAQRRLVPMQPNLLAWLTPYARAKGRICPHGSRWLHLHLDAARKRAGLVKWPNNGLRHSFASYRLASTQDAPRVALDMGHTGPQMLFKHYREVVTAEQAGRYWNIYPSPAGNVAALGAA